MLYVAPPEAIALSCDLLDDLLGAAERRSVSDDELADWMISAADDLLSHYMTLWIECARSHDEHALRLAAIDAAAAYVLVFRLAYEDVAVRMRAKVEMACTEVELAAWDENAKGVADEMAAVSGDYSAARRWLSVATKEVLERHMGSS